MSKMSKKTKKNNVQQKSVLYGAHAIIEMLKAKKRRLLSLYTRKPFPKAWNRISQYLPASIPNTQYVDKNVLDGIAQSPEHMGVVALVTPFRTRSKPFSPEHHPFILLLDGIQDVRNLGAILRSAYCTGVSGVVIAQNKSAPLCAAVFKASAGLAEHLEIYYAPSVVHAATALRKAGYTMYMAVIDGDDVTKTKFASPTCLVIGNEAVGISKDVCRLGTKITIPQRVPDVSYNASVAAGILLFHVSVSMRK